MNEIIQNKINSKNFSFMQLLNMKELAQSLAEETYEEISVTDQVRFAWDVKIIADGQTFGTLFRGIVVDALAAEFVNGLKAMAENATVNFGKDAPLNPPSEEAPPPPPPAEKTTTFLPPSENNDVVIGDDGLGLPSGVKRVF